ncbi:hypothetical protein ABWH98_24520 [Labrenzia sp. ac12]
MTFKIPYEEEEFSGRHAIKILREWRSEDTAPWMKRRAVNYLSPRCAALISVITLLVHLIWAERSSCAINFQRSGSLLVLNAAAFYAFIEWHKADGGKLSGGKLKRYSLFNPFIVLPIIAALGTVVWGYGDLLPLLSLKGCG